MKTTIRTRLTSSLFYLLRFGFRLLPVSEARRDQLRQSFLERFSGLVPPPAAGILPDHGTQQHRPRIRSDEPALGYIGHTPGSLPDTIPATLVAFYLPQFHPIPENDEWWGKSFTEWRNVTRALPQFEGHAQPRLPADLGYYDLRIPDVLREQMCLARKYGIGAFCMYFYWFGGKTLLEMPARQWLEDASLDFPICLCWANEKWTRSWDGRSSDILIDQQHNPDDDIAFIAHIADYLRDPRYLRMEGRPLLLLYRPGLLPDAKATASRWRKWCLDNGVGEIHLAYVQSFERPTPANIGFDSAVEFPPNLSTPPDITSKQALLNPEFKGQVLDWRALANEMREKSMPDYSLFPGVNCGWDNEPRRPGAGRIYQHASPYGYRDWLHDTVHKRLAAVPEAQRLVFINAWNEWAEGAVLEPDARLGHAWLEATRQALHANPPVSADPRPCAVVHVWYPELLEEIHQALQQSGIDWRLVVTTSHERKAEVMAKLAELGVDAETEAMENRGRDILPFLRVAYRLLDEGTDIVLKLHTKKSPHRKDGDTWRRELISSLLQPGRAHAILDAFSTDPELGLVAPEGQLQPLSYFWGANAANVHHLMNRIGIDLAADAEFIAGSMYWLRLRALRPLLDVHIEDWEFEDESGQLDGTMAHAVERLINATIATAGMHIRDIKRIDTPLAARP
ncbi:hypothetical protein CSC70_12445 [Pseudoxanthomonas kalamensis DSM 18571]|uniref:glycoside hydrolase family 99-like domain-containing protein n=1 Tax=Pseudoxanthomonas kalamensis TaxID=289483 RepID=UPI001390EE0E|nr:glycoside hydrolase family 99-like domain-containing protein [Pseudoxanthomonas kalamensis]KAF1708899.1 hypothetical protein CSC70_12445 [Pseudoxanthomonas kalamensis DSM 18571]